MKQNDAGWNGDDLFALEPEQRSTSRPEFSRRILGRGTRLLLVLLRIYITIAIPLVIYAFIRALRD